MDQQNGYKQLNDRRLVTVSRILAASDSIFRHVYDLYGPPPLWDRPAGFATLLQIILEQQVSLASAKACFDKLAACLGEVSPEGVLSLDDGQLRAVGFSRQKAAYARHLSEAVLGGRIDLDLLQQMPDDEVKAELINLKGIGEWTSDIYLLMALLRPDIMPKGDIALHAAYQKLSGLSSRPGSDEFVAMAEKWKPHRSVAARLLWHFYLSERRKPDR